MKRRGLGRRQVLNLNDKQDSPRRTWQTKYQQICSDSNQNGTYSDLISSTSSKSGVKSNPLSGLLGHYHSDSDTEDDSSKETTDTLSSQVSDFMKEIQTIAPAEKTAAVPQVVPSYQPAVDKKASNQNPLISNMPWQECYDETSGYAYYWNLETNEVTWEMPSEYQAYMESLAASQENPWAQDQHMSLAYNTNPHLMALHHHNNLNHPHHHHHVHLSGVSAAIDSSYHEKLLQSQSSFINYVQGSNGAKTFDKKKRKSKEVDSDDEKIEMITSYGPTSDDESEEEDEDNPSSPVKKRKVSNTKESKNKSSHKTHSLLPESEVEIGPKPLSVTGTLPAVTLDDNASEAEFSGSTLLSSQVQDCGAPGDENSQGEDSNQKSQEDSLINVKEIKQDSSDQYDVPDSSEEKSKSDTSSDALKPGSSSAPAQLNTISSVKHEEQDISEEAVKSGTSTPIVLEPESDDIESTESEERLILTRLRNQARLLRELGGEVPDEVQHLIEPSGSSESPIQVDDVIAEIEKELPPDYNNKKEEKRKNTLTQKSPFPSKSKSSTKISSFALIAGYGDDGEDSDPEEEKRSNSRSSSSRNSKIVLEQKSENQTLFPIMCSLEKADQEKSSESLAKSIDKIGEQSSVCISGDSTNFLKGSRTFDSNEPVSSNTVSLETNLPDSTTNCKLFKRKKRLDVEVLPAVSSKQSTVIAQSAESEPEKKLPHNSSTVSSAVSSSGAYSTWTPYSVDPSSSERRGFGFQPNAECHGFTETSSDDQIHFVEGESKTAPQKKGIINFVKAEVLIPENSSSHPEVEILSEERAVQPSLQDSKAVTCFDNAKGKVREMDKVVEEMADMIREKVSFLGEGKDPVPPVQVMTIQIETLMSAWETGALSLSYWSRWLADTSTELARLEQAAAPSGWACEWDRSYKRYFYRNITSGDTQWEYPSTTEEDAMELCTTPPPPPPPIISRSDPSESPPKILSSNLSDGSSSVAKKKKTEDTVSSSSEDAKEGDAGHPDCLKESDSTAGPPPPPTDPPPLPPPPPPPPPPTISPTPPPPPPPPISEDLPPLPPNTPPLPPDSPPPLPPTPPPPPAIHSHGGEPLPPGVDVPELPYIVARPPLPSSKSFLNTSVNGPSVSKDTTFPPLPTQSPPDTTDLNMAMVREDSIPMAALPHHLQAQYMMGAAYQQAAIVTSSIPGIPMNPGTGLEYGPVQYVPSMAMPVMPTASVHVIAKPPAKSTKSSLHAELYSFYSDLASLESVNNSAASQETSEQTPANDIAPVGSAPAIQSLQHHHHHHHHQPSTQQNPDSNSTLSGAQAVQNNHSAGTSYDETSNKGDTSSQENRKRKKPKLAPGLALKKKGVSSLVAKWQQVQQEVRRDFKNLDEEESVSSTHK